jgi:hydrogenase maturation protease
MTGGTPLRPGPAAAGAGAGRTVIIGVGNEFRRDDGAGPEVVTRLRERVPPSVQLMVSDGEPAALLEAWTGASLAIVVDAVVADRPVPGRLHRIVLAGAGQAGQPPRQVSSHGLGLSEAISLAQALRRMPGQLIVHAVEAADVSQGSGLSPGVAAAVGELAAAVLRDLSA